MYSKITLDALNTLLKSSFKEVCLSLKDLPQPSTLKYMDKATMRIVDAIKNREKLSLLLEVTFREKNSRKAA